jgi:hypothetical protein
VSLYLYNPPKEAFLTSGVKLFLNKSVSQSALGFHDESEPVRGPHHAVGTGLTDCRTQLLSYRDTRLGLYVTTTGTATNWIK